MAFAGGAADKVGNEYEVWWTLRRVTQLLRGELDSMAVEPLGGDGAELWVERRGARTFDQVKFRSAGRWTPSRLRTDGVLAKLRRHYVAGAGVLLVMNQPSEELERHIALAGATASGAELWQEGDANALRILADAWGVGENETRQYLRQTSVRHDGLPHLKEFVELVVETLVTGDPTLAIGVVRQFLEENLSKPFTAPMIWAALEANGISMRPRLDAGPTIERLRAALDRHLRAARRTMPSAGAIRRSAVDNIVATVTESSSPILLVAGTAGAGKSVVVAEAAEELARSGRHVAALRLDRLDPRTSTAAQLGTAIDLERSPVLTLSEVSSDEFDGILVIDQLDAVSSYSGRMPDVYDAVDEALTQARLLGNVKVILSVRSIDLAEDPRLRKLAGDDVPTITVGELEEIEVQSYLARIGTDISTVNPVTLQLLRLPIHLYVFSELAPELRSASYGTLTALYDAFTKSFRNRLELANFSDEWPEVSRILVEHMNATEALAVSMKTLERIRPFYVEALVSSNVLITDEGRVALFHETFFDYLFAKSFSERGQALVEWFARSGQGLFRRSQLRQLLVFIAAEERSRFIEHILALANSSLRPHLISIAYTALGDIVPTPTEWTAIEPLASADNPLGARIISLIGSPHWFAAANAVGDVEKLLDQPEHAERVAHLVARLAGELPNEVYELLVPRLENGEVWVNALRSALDVTDSPKWAEFALEQVHAQRLDLPDRPFDILESPIFHRLIGPHPLDALRMLSLMITHEVDDAIAGQKRSVKDVLDRRSRRSVDAGEIAELAASVGPEFVTTLLPLIEKIATHVPAIGWQMWRYRVRADHHDFAEELFFAFDRALTQLTQVDIARALPILERLSAHQDNALDFLVCRALLEATPDDAVTWLLQSKAHLEVGWSSDGHWKSRRLIERASVTCSEDLFSALESAILYFPDGGWSPADRLRWSGSTELRLLSALSRDRLSFVASKRLAELQRKFPWWQPQEPTGISGGTVRSPISRHAAERMTDAHWRNAMKRYGIDGETKFSNGHAYGGLHELASLMGSLSKEDPARFLALALSFPASTPAAYTEHIVRDLAGEVDQLALLPLLRKFRADHPSESGRAVASAIDAYAGQLEDDLFEELLNLSDDEDPREELATKRTNTGTYFGGDFVSAGINSTRGLVASTLGRVLFADHGRLGASLSVLRRLASDPIIAVRALAAEPALAYASVERTEGLDLIAQLLDDDTVLGTATALRALRWAMLWDSDRFADYLVRALQAEDAKIAGADWANCSINDSLGSAPKDVTLLSESARLGVADALAPVPHLGADLLLTLFDDPSLQVRRQAGRAVYYLKEMDGLGRGELIARLVNSRAFATAANDLLHALEELPGELPEVTWEVCRRVIDDISDDHPSGIGALEGNLVAVLVRLYRSASDGKREAALDLIDETVLLQLWRVDQVLDEAR